MEMNWRSTSKEASGHSNAGLYPWERSEDWIHWNWFFGKVYGFWIVSLENRVGLRLMSCANICLFSDPSSPTSRILPNLPPKEDRSACLRRIKMCQLCPGSYRSGFLDWGAEDCQEGAQGISTSANEEALRGVRCRFLEVFWWLDLQNQQELAVSISGLLQIMRHSCLRTFGSLPRIFAKVYHFLSVQIMPTEKATSIKSRLKLEMKSYSLAVSCDGQK